LLVQAVESANSTSATITTNTSASTDATIYVKVGDA
jgi:hypothetical protein